MLHDSILTVGNSTIQMGAYNDRIYLMSLAAEDGPAIVDEIINMAVAEDLSKIFAKVPESQALHFLSCGFEKEAEVPDMFDGDDGVFLSFYRYLWRKEQSDKEELDRVLAVAESKKGKGNVSTLPSSLQMRRLGPEDAHALAHLYGQTFKTYPFPITDPDFIRQEMEDGVRFMGVYEDSKLVGAASAEVASDGNSAEMTDFAVNPDYRKMGIAGALLRALEKDCTESGIKCLFTIARACSYGINSLFSKGEYKFSGQLKNNTNISGRLESMNIWYKVVEE
ncbi:putative beta-lysine N-acetyltransferase [Maridesulfovibrio salexigens]|uniref:GCN5-related N-acetyltransferase n=1 Tax=Maridesulfovibrio salexigens (strain ATCC 14822 / DSM 2638 / NCIMB 8403 / VKM B-1763) TaxID=526222 RepID=C6BRY2_MARSD|nr:putative beta-lysine N-acetyltransferase [Maridesulfovibrio salexigens]ACS81365.1 GCN5-related N-acetyltransferase [Maridesulfovibrio salexigens DSM 2638]